MTDPDFTDQVLRLFAGELADELYWDVDGEGEITFWVICNDAFWWACADGEDVTPDNIHLMVEAKEELGDEFEHAAPLLFVCKVREMRPQGAVYDHIDKEVWHLFDACGPKREVGMGNPKPHPLDR